MDSPVSVQCRLALPADQKGKCRERGDVFRAVGYEDNLAAAFWVNIILHFSRSVKIPKALS